MLISRTRLESRIHGVLQYGSVGMKLLFSAEAENLEISVGRDKWSRFLPRLLYNRTNASKRCVAPIKYYFLPWKTSKTSTMCEPRFFKYITCFFNNSPVLYTLIQPYTSIVTANNSKQWRGTTNRAVWTSKDVPMWTCRCQCWCNWRRHQTFSKAALEVYRGESALPKTSTTTTSPLPAAVMLCCVVLGFHSFGRAISSGRAGKKRLRERSGRRARGGGGGTDGRTDEMARGQIITRTDSRWYNRCCVSSEIPELRHAWHWY